jgi:levanase/fructan beta-fructosidase
MDNGFVAGDRTMFYGSKTLKDWKLLSDFGKEIELMEVFGNVQIFPMLVDGTDDYKWVMLLSINLEDLEGSATQYFRR